MSPGARALVVALLVLACRPREESAPPPPADASKAVARKPAAEPGPALVANNCVGCHGEEMLVQQRLSEKQWDAVVKKMQTWGAPLEPERAAELVAYLSASFGATAGPYEPVGVASAEAALQVEPLPDGPFGNGDVSTGRKLYEARCAACHAPDALGGPLGVNLVDRYLLYRADEFAKIVRAGRGRMPAFQTSDVEIGHVLAYLRGLGA